MSLQVWLPLTKDLINQGLSNVTVTNSGATFNSVGKLGGCYSFNNSAIGIGATNITLGNTFSIACWIKVNSYNVNWANAFKIYKDSYDYIGLCMNQTSSSTKQLGFHIYKNGGSNTHTGVSDTYYMPLTVNMWYHLCFVVTPSEVKTYQNGVNIRTSSVTTTFPSVSNYNLGLGKSSLFAGLDCSLNDFRLYDNALSETEIKEIAKGLVLHLPLNNNGLGNENLLTNTNDLTLWNKESGVTINWDSNQQMYKMVVNKTNNTSRWGIYQDFTVTPNTTYTFTVEGIKGDHYTCAAIQTYETTTAWPTNRYTFKTIKTKGVYTFTSGANDTVGRVYLNLTPIPDTGNKTAWFLHPKLELGDKATPWCPNPVDEIYPASGSGISENLFAATDMSEPITGTSSSDWTKHFRMYNGSAAIHTINTTEMTDTIALTTANSNLGIAFARLNKEINLDSTQYYTISCEAKCTNASLNLCIGLSYYNDQSTWVWRGGSNAKTFTAANTWQKITHTFKPDANTYAIYYCFTINPGASPSGTDTFSIRKCKLEKGSVATEWQPSPVDDSYKTLGYYNNIEYDTSGYNHNGVKYGNLTYLSDAPKYNVSTKFSDGSYIKYKGPESMYQATYAFWVKSASYTAYNMIHGPLGSLSAGTSPWLSVNTESSGAWAYFGNNSPNYTKVSGTISTDTWHHLVYVWDNGVARWYIDGAPSGNAVTYTTRTFIQNTAESSIGDSYTGTNWGGTPFTGQLSDFRIYATALSEKDILSLYNNNAYIDANNNIHGKIRD